MMGMPRGSFMFSVCTDLCTGSWFMAPHKGDSPFASARRHAGQQHTAKDQFRERGRDLAMDLQVGLHILLR